jgi:hypothetical protein
MIWAMAAAAATAAAAMMVPADAPIVAQLAGQPVQLQLRTGSVDRLTLNTTTVARLGLKPAIIMGKADLNIGGKRVLRGRNTVAKGQLAGQSFKGRVLWFEGAAPLPADGAVGPMALPAPKVVVTLGQVANAQAHNFPLVGDADSTSHAIVRGEGYVFLMTLGVEQTARLPIASAATGADLAAALGGRLEGEPWQEEILLGITRPVRRLVLDRPLVVGPWAFREIAVRVRDLVDASATLSPDQQAIADADADPAEIAVVASSGKGRGVARFLSLGRPQLANCARLEIDKAARTYSVHCR